MASLTRIVLRARIPGDVPSPPPPLGCHNHAPSWYRRLGPWPLRPPCGPVARHVGASTSARILHGRRWGSARPAHLPPCLCSICGIRFSSSGAASSRWNHPACDHNCRRTPNTVRCDGVSPALTTLRHIDGVKAPRRRSTRAACPTPSACSPKQQHMESAQPNNMRLRLLPR